MRHQLSLQFLRKTVRDVVDNESFLQVQKSPESPFAEPLENGFGLVNSVQATVLIYEDEDYVIVDIYPTNELSNNVICS